MNRVWRDLLGRVVHSNKVRQQGLPALCLARRSSPKVLSGWGLPSGPLVSFASIISTTPNRHHVDQRANPPVFLGKSRQLLRFQWFLCAHDLVYDPGRLSVVSPLRHR